MAFTGMHQPSGGGFGSGSFVGQRPQPTPRPPISDGLGGSGAGMGGGFASPGPGSIGGSGHPTPKWDSGITQPGMRPGLPPSMFQGGFDPGGVPQELKDEYTKYREGHESRWWEQDQQNPNDFLKWFKGQYGKPWTPRDRRPPMVGNKMNHSPRGMVPPNLQYKNNVLSPGTATAQYRFTGRPLSSSVAGGSLSNIINKIQQSGGGGTADDFFKFMQQLSR